MLAQGAASNASIKQLVMTAIIGRLFALIRRTVIVPQLQKVYFVLLGDLCG